MPKTYLTFLAGWLAICGVIPFSGFWSKDEILWNAASTTYIPGGWMLWIIGTIAATCTAFYMTRLVALTFWGKERFLDAHAGGQADEAHAHGFDEGVKPHDAQLESAGDRPRHEPGEYVGAPPAHDDDATAHTHQTAHGAHAVHEEAHGHGTHVPHESPASMWVPLAVLAVLAIVGGFVGVGPAFKFITGSDHPGGRMNIVNWLDPVIWNPATGEFGKEHAAATEHAEGKGENDKGKSEGTAEGGVLVASTSAAIAFQEESHGGATKEGGASHGATTTTATPGDHDDNAAARSDAGAHAATATGASSHSPYGDTGYNLAHEAEHALGSHAAAEWLFIIISLAVAGLGILLGLLFYLWRPHLPGVWAARLPSFYRASFNKYWVDELYGALFTRRTMDAARAVYTADAKVVDGAVNGAARVTRDLSRLTGNADRYVVDGLVNTVAGFVGTLMSPLIRAAQTGFIQNYALVMVLGLVVAVALYFGGGILSSVRGLFAAIF